jgi:protein-S-isoprenylcysteine O-methyltransferase
MSVFQGFLLSVPIEMIALIGFFLWALMERGFQLLNQQQIKGISRGYDVWLLSLIWYGTMLISFLDAGKFHWTLLPVHLRILQWIGAALTLAGLAFRFLARKALGRQFSVNVQTSYGHRLVRTGIYRIIRHPAYLGLLLLLPGIPLCSGSILGTALGVLAGFPALMRRIRMEEQALLEWFGEEYRQLQRETSRLIPGLW